MYAQFILGFFTAVTIICLALGFVGRNPFAKKPKVVAKKMPPGIRDSALYCTCDHLSNVHDSRGKCTEETFTGNRYQTCKCQRYTGPMGLVEIELWGPKELNGGGTRVRVGDVAAPRRELTRQEETARRLAEVQRTPDVILDRSARTRLGYEIYDGQQVRTYYEQDRP